MNILMKFNVGFDFLLKYRSLKIIAVCFIFFLCSHATLSQQKPDSFISDYYRLRTKSQDSTLMLCEQLINSKDAKKRIFGFAGKAYVYAMRADYSEADVFFEKANQEIRQDKNGQNLEIRGNVNYLQALRFIESHELEQTISYVNKALVFCAEDCSDFLKIRLNSILGRAYSLSKNHIEAIEISKKSLTQIKEMSDFQTNSDLKKEYLKELVIISHRFTNFYVLDKEKNLKYLDSIRHYGRLTKEYAQKHQIIDYDGNITIIYGELNFNLPTPNYEVAKQYYEEGLEIFLIKNHKKRVAQFRFRIAEIDYYLKNFDKAERTFKKQLEDDVWSEFQLLNSGAECHFYLFKINEWRKNPEEVLYHAKKYAEKIKEHLRIKNESDMSVNEVAQYKKKEEEIKGYIDNYEQEKKQKKTYIYLLLGLFVVASSSIAYFIYVKRRDKKNISQLNERIAQLQMNVSRKNGMNKKSALSDENALKLIKKLKALEKEELFLQPNYTLNKVAKKLKTNSSYLSETVNKYLDVSFAEYSNRLRINSFIIRLKEEKQMRNYTIEALAQEAGYKSVTSFNNNFKKYLKITPSQYLKELRRA